MSQFDATPSRVAEHAERAASTALSIPAVTPANLATIPRWADAESSAAPPSVATTLAGQGEPLDAASRRQFAPALGWDLADVRVHRDADAVTSARDVAAAAYTVGRHVVLGEGAAGRPEVLAHELAHATQQRAVSTPPATPTVGRADSPDEHAAHAFAAGLATTQLAPGHAHLARYPDPPTAVAAAGISLGLAATGSTTTSTLSTTRTGAAPLPGGWAGETGASAAPAWVGTVARIPIEGLGSANRSVQQPLPGGAPVPASQYAAATRSGGRAVALVPDAIRTAAAGGQVDVLLHLHGLGPALRASGNSPMDVQEYDMPQQIEAWMAANTGQRLIALMPVGVQVASQNKDGDWGYHNVSFGGMAPDAFIGECFTKLAGVLPSGATPGRVVLSGHSGGGLEISRLISSGRLPANLAGVFSFESIHGDEATWIGFVTSRLDADLRRLTDLHADASLASPPALLAAQRGYVSGGLRVIAFARPAAQTDYGQHVGAIHRAVVAWFGRNEAALARATNGANVIAALLWNNYQAVATDTAGHPQALATSEHNLFRALSTLGPPRGAPAATVPPTTVPPTTVPPTTVPPTVTPSATPGTVARFPWSILPPPRLPRLPVSPADAVAAVTAVAISEGHVDGTAAQAPDTAHTRMRAETIRNALASASTNPQLTAALTIAVIAICAATDIGTYFLAVADGARSVVKVVENEFVADDTRSGYELLPPTSASRFGGFAWGSADFPGGPVGSHEDTARAMIGAMNAVVPERRANIGSTPILVGSEFTAATARRIIDNLQRLHTQPRFSLIAPAATAFDTMEAAAAADGVALPINNSFRTAATAAANAAAANNSQAVANFSAHTLGVAFDLNLSTATQHFAETATAPMQNVSDMHAAPAYKWMALHAETFGWYAFGNEPWHWEYNPPGFRAVYRALVLPPSP